jgi:Flp pilus assembly protein TadG
VNPFLATLQGGRVTRAGHGAEQGSATILVVGLAIVLFACAGLAIDGGRAINARDKATDVAEQAARAGSGQLDDAQLRQPGGAVVLDQAAAQLREEQFVADAGASYVPTTTTTRDSVTVKVSWTYKTAILGIVGINSIDVSGSATASPATGPNGANP